jgi:hypothetical protein
VVGFDPYELVREQCGPDTRLTGGRHAWALTAAVELPATLAASAFGSRRPVGGLLRTELRPAPPAGRPATPRLLAERAAFRATSVFTPDQPGLVALMGKPEEATLRTTGEGTDVDVLELTLLVPAHLASRARLEDATWDCHPFLELRSRAAGSCAERR